MPEVLSTVALKISQLAEVLGSRLAEIWSAAEADDRSASCVTYVHELQELEGCQSGELVILDSSVAVDVYGNSEQLLHRDLAGVLLPETKTPAQHRTQFQERAAKHRLFVGLLALGIEPRQVALELTRAQGFVREEIIAPELRSEETLQGVAETLGRLVGNSVTIETPTHELLASSPTGPDVDQDRVETILHRRAAAKIMNHPDFKRFFSRVRTSDWPLHLEAHPNLGHSGRIAMRIAADGELYGVIWVTDTARGLGDRDYAAIHQAADVAAAIFVRQQLTARRESMLRAELLDEVIKGRISDPENIRTIALSVGWNVDRLQQALVVAIDDFEAFRVRHTRQGGARLHRTQERLVELVKLEVLGIDPEAVIGMRSASVVVLLDVRDEGDADRKARVTRLADAIVKRTSAFMADMKVTVGIGRHFTSLEQMAESFRQAELTAGLGQSLWGGNVALHYDDLGIHRVLYTLRDTEGMVTPPLQRLISYDHDHGTDYVHTLWAYLKNMGRLRQAAEELNIHRNTLEYRVTRIAELAGVELDDPDSRLALELGIRVLQLGATA